MTVVAELVIESAELGESTDCWVKVETPWVARRIAGGASLAESFSVSTGTAGQVQVEVLRGTTLINNQPPVPSAIKSAHIPLTLIAMITGNCLPLNLRIASWRWWRW
jgi:hypothetical protein